jgi:hypothetical protein
MTGWANRGRARGLTATLVAGCGCRKYIVAGHRLVSLGGRKRQTARIRACFASGIASPA